MDILDHKVLGLSREDTGEMIQFVRSFKLVRCQTSCRHVRDAGYLNKIPHFALSPERAANSQTAHLTESPSIPVARQVKLPNPTKVLAPWDERNVAIDMCIQRESTRHMNYRGGVSVITLDST